jgi:hypothetical protein
MIVRNFYVNNSTCIYLETDEEVVLYFEHVDM